MVSGNTKEEHKAWWGGGWGGGSGDEGGRGAGWRVPTGLFHKTYRGGGRKSLLTHDLFSDAGGTARGGPAGSVSPGRRPVRPGRSRVRSGRRRRSSRHRRTDRRRRTVTPADRSGRRGRAKKTHGFIHRRHHQHRRPVKKDESTFFLYISKQKHSDHDQTLFFTFCRPKS